MAFLFFLCILISLSFWLSERTKSGQYLFFVSFASWMVWLVIDYPWSEATFLSFVWALLLLGVAGAIHLVFKLKSKSIQGLAWTILALIGYWGIQKKINTPLLILDPEAELLIELQVGRDPSAIKELLGINVLAIRKAFSMSDPESALNRYYSLDLKNDPVTIIKVKELLTSKTALVAHFENNEVLYYEKPVLSKINKLNHSWTNDPGLVNQWYLDYLGAENFHRDLSAVKPVKTSLLAILDTGIEGKHEDLISNYQSSGSEHDHDPIGHGTHCAGIAGAVTGNGKGIASLIPAQSKHLKLTGIKVLKYNGSGTQKDIINGIIKATDLGADVISLSLGGPSDDLKQRAYELAVEYAAKRNAIIVVAAGNNNADARKYSPANVKGLIAVTAIDQSGRLASFSNHVTHLSMGVAAPGVGIYSTIPDNKYTSFNGTSMATPLVASVIATIKALNPDMSTAQVYNHITKDVTSVHDPKTGVILKLDRILSGL